jgi:hypothetical protein
MNGSWRLIDQYAALHEEFAKLGYTASWNGEKFLVTDKAASTDAGFLNALEDDIRMADHGYGGIQELLKKYVIVSRLNPASGRPLTTATETENEVEEDLNISARPTGGPELHTPYEAKAGCSHERLDMDGICRRCGADKRGFGA